MRPSPAASLPRSKGVLFIRTSKPSPERRPSLAKSVRSVAQMLPNNSAVWRRLASDIFSAMKGSPALL